MTEVYIPFSLIYWTVKSFFPINGKKQKKYKKDSQSSDFVISLSYHTKKDKTAEKLSR